MANCVGQGVHIASRGSQGFVFLTWARGNRIILANVKFIANKFWEAIVCFRWDVIFFNYRCRQFGVWHHHAISKIASGVGGEVTSGLCRSVNIFFCHSVFVAWEISAHGASVGRLRVVLIRVRISFAVRGVGLDPRRRLRPVRPTKGRVRISGVGEVTDAKGAKQVFHCPWGLRSLVNNDLHRFLWDARYVPTNGNVNVCIWFCLRLCFHLSFLLSSDT